jgi:Bacterial PH domain
VALGVGLVTVILAVISDPAGGMIPLAIMVAAIAFVGAISLPTEYIVEDTQLVVRSGMMRRSIPFDAIFRVYPTRNPLSAPAWSLDRLGIDFRVKGQRRLALISPLARSDFLTLLQKRAGLDSKGDELLRAGSKS